MVRRCSRFRQLLVRPFALLAVMFILAGCSSLPRTAYTASDAASSTVLDLSELRRYADEPASMFLKTNVNLRSGPLSYLALSGGGADGAYGAGVLNGWTAAGTRPQFSVVSGVSTGCSDCTVCISRPRLRCDIARRLHQRHCRKPAQYAKPRACPVRVWPVRQHPSARTRRPLCRTGHARGHRRRIRQGQKPSRS